MEKRIRVNVLGVLVACLVIAGAADAAITYEVSGTVTMTNAWSLGTSVPSLFTVGDILTGQLTFEPRTVGVVVGSPALAWVFTDAFSDVSLTFPATSTAMTAAFAPPHIIDGAVADNQSLVLSDTYASGFTISSYAYTSGSMYWEDPTNCLFDTGPPTLSPSLILDQGQFYFFWNRGGRLDLDNRVWVHGEVTLTELSVRPAPSALALTTTGVVSLVGARRRRRRL